MSDEGQIPYERTETVAVDVSEMQKTMPLELGRLAELGLASFNLYAAAHSTDSHIAEYIMAWSTYQKDTSRLLSESLKSLYRAQPSWAGSDIAQACTMVRVD